jgi:hypothetical protein
LEQKRGFGMNQKLLAMIAGLAISATYSAPPAHAVPITYFADLSGAAESPPNASPGTGFAQVIIDIAAHTLQVTATFSDLLGTTTAAHIHCCTATAGTGTAGVATQTPSFVGFPLGVTSGSYSSPVFDLTVAGSWNAAFIAANGGTIAAAEAALALGLAAGEAYFNIHTTVVPGGEIRGFLAPTPLPTALPLFVTGLGALGLLGWRRKKKAAAVAD